MKKLPFERPIIKKLNVGISNKFGLRTELEPITHIDDVSVSELIKE
jgi:diaminopimelate decarboxylase